MGTGLAGGTGTHAISGIRTGGHIRGIELAVWTITQIPHCLIEKRYAVLEKPQPEIAVGAKKTPNFVSVVVVVYREPSFLCWRARTNSAHPVLVL
jgi:hypothetical protein